MAACPFRRHPEAHVPASDEAVFRQVQRGDRSAFATLVDRFERRAYAVAIRLLGRREDAEDAVQQAFLRLYESRGSYNPRWRLNTWFYRILVNACVDELRRRRPTESADVAEMPGTDSPERAAMDRDRSRRVQAALGAVPTEARIVLTLFYGDGRSCQEIGRIRGVSVNTVKTHLRRGRLALRRALRRQGVDVP
jgi:RNA polymerase sigma-70 factor (ECF subfamily)